MEEKINELISRIEAIKEQDPEGLDPSFDTELKHLNRDIKTLRAAQMIMAEADDPTINHYLTQAAELARGIK